MIRETERRELFSEISSAPNGPRRIFGRAAAYSVTSQAMPGGLYGRPFVEVIAPGAFDKVASDPNLDCRCLLNHDPSLILGRTKSGTLTVRASASGLDFDCDLPDTQTARDVHASVARGDINQCSFGFKLEDGDDEWEEKFKDGRSVGYVRTIRNVSHLFDVSVVTYPAYENGTAAGARALGLQVRHQPRPDYILPSLPRAAKGLQPLTKDEASLVLWLRKVIPQGFKPGPADQEILDRAYALEVQAFQNKTWS